VLPLTQSYDTLEGKKLCFASSNTCAFPGCRQTMYDFEQKVKICDILHNKAVQKGDLRYNEIKLLKLIITLSQKVKEIMM
jgi:hypothetical protein